MNDRNESRLERYLKDISDRFSISRRNQDILIGRISKHKTYYELAARYDVSTERITQIVMRFWQRIWDRFSAINRGKEDEIEKAISELKGISLYNPEKIGNILKHNYNRNIIEYDFSTRVFKCLRQSGIKTIDQIAERTVEDLLKIGNLGRKSIQEIKDRLAKYGYSLMD